MSTPSTNLLLHGVESPPQIGRPLRAGPLDCLLDGVDLRYVHHGGVEVVRRIYAAVRDRNWNTIPGLAGDVTVDDRDDEFEVRFSVSHRSRVVDVTWEGAITGHADGRIVYEFDGAVGRDLLYNRIGICVLHPYPEVAGRRWRARTLDGDREGELPSLIAPQPFENGVYVPLVPAFDRLSIELPLGGRAELDFEGDLWEAEDQRNWTDASLKSYCTPLARGFPHAMKRGGRVVQRVACRVEGAPAACRRPADPDAVTIELGERLEHRLPPIGLGHARDAGELTERETLMLRALGPAHLRIDASLAAPDWEARLDRALRARERLEVDAELAIALTAEHGALLERLAQLIADVPLARVLAFQSGALSAQPDETTPAALVELVRAGLEAEVVGGGSYMNFCELNRTRPLARALDAIGYGVTSQIHAIDDLSLMETPPAHGDTVVSARAFAEGRPVVVGPITLRPRFNSVATADEPDPDPAQLPASADPRQASLIGAAWTLASAKHLAEGGAAALTYYETVGWGGVIEHEAPDRRADDFPSVPGHAYPLYHVLADLCESHGAALLASDSSAPLRAAALALGNGTILAANLTAVAQTVSIGPVDGSAALRRLGLETVAPACGDPARFRAAPLEPVQARGRLRLSLSPFETVRIER
jgi:hypothetical protein